MQHQHNGPKCTSVDQCVVYLRLYCSVYGKISGRISPIFRQIVQPTVHYLEWPTRMREAAYNAGRFSEHTKTNPVITSPPTSTTNDSTAAATVAATMGTLNNQVTSGRMTMSAGKQSTRAERRGVGASRPSSAAGINDAEAAMRSARDSVTALEAAKRAAVFTGGVTFRTDELGDFVAVVIGTPSETVTFDSNGGLLRSSILHPLFSVRIPKLALKETLTTTFKVSLNFLCGLLFNS